MISNNFEARVTMEMDTIMFMILLLCVFCFFFKIKKKRKKDNGKLSHTHIDEELYIHKSD